MVPGSNEEIQKLATMVEFLRRLGEGLGKVLNADVVALTPRNRALLARAEVGNIPAFANEAIRRAGEALLEKRRGAYELAQFREKFGPTDNPRAAAQFDMDFPAWHPLLRELLAIEVDDPAEAVG